MVDYNHYSVTGNTDNTETGLHHLLKAGRSNLKTTRTNSFETTGGAADNNTAVIARIARPNSG